MDQAEMTQAVTIDACGERPTLGNSTKVEIIDADGLRSIDGMDMLKLCRRVQVADRGWPLVTMED